MEGKIFSVWDALQHYIRKDKNASLSFSFYTQNVQIYLKRRFYSQSKLREIAKREILSFLATTPYHFGLVLSIYLHMQLSVLQLTRHVRDMFFSA